MDLQTFVKARTISSGIFLAIISLVIFSGPVQAQLTEPDVRSVDEPQTPLDEGLNNRIGGSIFVNNFGFGIGGTYSHALGQYTELTFFTGITGIRDVSEQSFQDFFTGQRIVPNKYNRALGFPFIFGLKKRIFPREIADNFRFFVAASGGPAMAFVYPYLNDKDNNGYRSSRIVETPGGRQVQVFTEEKNDIFSGWGDGSTEWGAAGEIKVGVDLGSNFKQQSTLEIGYFFYYFDQGLQIMEPFRPTGFDSEGFSTGQDPFFDDQKFFGTPQIKFTFSGWW
ncbi:MAG: hypothetical protein JXR26_09875 [Balneolaceae bacterium]|nr:hypothetical protein [Balneolaceae bacterium]